MHAPVSITRRFAAGAVTALTLAGGAGGVFAQASGSDPEFSPISGDPAKPRRHTRLVGPAKLSPERAQEVYEIVRQSLRAGYGKAGRVVASGYQDWRRFNVAPYLSAAHGNHYLSNYVNAIGADTYGKFERGGAHPVGTVIAKDSFSLTRSGEILLGALYLMEKMPSGFNHASGDWKYALIRPDGTFVGETNGSGRERVEYCIGCHLAKQNQDHLWFLPRAFRVGRKDGAK